MEEINEVDAAVPFVQLHRIQLGYPGQAEKRRVTFASLMELQVIAVEHDRGDSETLNLLEDGGAELGRG